MATFIKIRNFGDTIDLVNLDQVKFIDPASFEIEIISGGRYQIAYPALSDPIWDEEDSDLADKFMAIILKYNKIEL